MTEKEYRKIAPIKAEQFDGSAGEAKRLKLVSGSDRGWDYDRERYYVRNSEDDIFIFPDDYIATGIDGERWPIRKDIFERMYEELPVIPKDVAKYIRELKKYHRTLTNVLGQVENLMIMRTMPSGPLAWVMSNQDTFVRAWLDGYQVEED
jgi:hypothetical protein